MKLPREDYWAKLVDYYYDNVHWTEPGPPSIYQWLERDFGGETRFGAQNIYFKDPAKCSWFILRWQ